MPAGGELAFADGGGDTTVFRSVLPEWVVPGAGEVSDCYWLAYRTHVEYLGGTPGAVATTLVWVAGGEPSPMTGRRNQPVTVELADMEDFATYIYRHPDAPIALREIYAKRGVAYRPVLQEEHVTPQGAGRVWRPQTSCTRTRWPGSRGAIRLWSRRRSCGTG